MILKRPICPPLLDRQEDDDNHLPTRSRLTNGLNPISRHHSGVELCSLPLPTPEEVLSYFSLHTPELRDKSPI